MIFAYACIFKCLNITHTMVVKEQENKISIDKTQIINDYNQYKQGRDILTELKLLSERQNIFQNDFVTVTDSYNIWMILFKEQILESHH